MDNNLFETHSFKQAKEWCEQGKNHIPNEFQVGLFVRDLLPYLEHLEARVKELEETKSNNSSIK